MKCHFDYDPARDSLIPCKEAGLCFTAGDLLQIVNQDDANWWQVSPRCHTVQVWCVEKVRVWTVSFHSGRALPLSISGMPRRRRQRWAHPQPAAGGEAESLCQTGPGADTHLRYKPHSPNLGSDWSLCLASFAHLSATRDPVWQPFRKEKEANDVFDHQECR